MKGGRQNSGTLRGWCSSVLQKEGTQKIPRQQNRWPAVATTGAGWLAGSGIQPNAPNPPNPPPPLSDVRPRRRRPPPQPPPPSVPPLPQLQ